MLASSDAARGRFVGTNDYIAYGPNGFVALPELGIEVVPIAPSTVAPSIKSTNFAIAAVS